MPSCDVNVVKPVTKLVNVFTPEFLINRSLKKWIYEITPSRHRRLFLIKVYDNINQYDIHSVQYELRIFLLKSHRWYKKLFDANKVLNMTT